MPKIGPALETDLGMGFCLDAQCRFIATNYHVAALARPHKIKGDEVIQQYLATGPEDDGATTNDVFSEKPMKYTLSRDFAVFELRHPLPHYHGIRFSLDAPEIDQPVDIDAYPEEPRKPVRNLQRFHGVFSGRTTSSLLAFEYSFANGRPIRHGASGGLVVDRKTQEIVGVLSRVGLGTNGHAVALALAVPTVADFVSMMQPWLAQSLFPTSHKETLSPASADLYPEFVPLPFADSLSPWKSRLRQKARLLADTMRNFVAVESSARDQEISRPPLSLNRKSRCWKAFSDSASIPTGKKSCRACPSLP